jgi:hypothetical protein
MITLLPPLILINGLDAAAPLITGDVPAAGFIVTVLVELEPEILGITIGNVSDDEL